MKFASAVIFLVAATMMATFSLLSFMLFPRPLSLDNPTLLVETMFVGGLMLMYMSIHQLRRQTLNIKH